jgi:hypothetical protein
MNVCICFRCFDCHARIKAPVQLVGQSRTCPGCGASLVVQLKGPPPSGSRLGMKEFAPPRQAAHR